MFCKECGSEIEDGAVVCPRCGCNVMSSVEISVNSDGKTFRKRKTMVLAISIVAAVSVLAIICSGISKASRKLSSITSTSDNQTGAVFNVSLSEYNKAFDKAYKDLTGEVSESSISELWDNVVPEQTGIEEGSGKEFTQKTITLRDYGITISVELIDGYVCSSICSISNSFAGSEMTYKYWQVCSYCVSTACTGETLDEYNDIFSLFYASDGMTGKVVKENALHNLYFWDDSFGFGVTAVSDAFVKILEESNVEIIKK